MKRTNTDKNIAAFLRVLDPADNQTGGGAASATAGAMAAALVGMTARVSVGKRNMVEPSEYYQEIDRQAQALAIELLAGAGQDSQAYDKVFLAYRLPKSTNAEKVARADAIQKALIRATNIPLNNAKNCADVLDLAAKLKNRSNPNAASDLECGYNLAIAGLKGALSNANANIATIEDKTVATKLTQIVTKYISNYYPTKDK